MVLTKGGDLDIVQERPSLHEELDDELENVSVGQRRLGTDGKENEAREGNEKESRIHSVRVSRC